MNELRALLERHGGCYGDLRLAIGWTDGITGEAAKQNTKGWKGTKPLQSAEQGRSIMGTAVARNPIVCLGASGLIGVDIDGPSGLTLSRRLVPQGWPLTVTVRSGRMEGGLHLWFRPPTGTWPAKIELSADGLEMPSDGYLVIPPAVHGETGARYTFVDGRAPWEIAIATLPTSILEALLSGKRRTSDFERADDQGPIPAGGRHRHLRRIAGAMRRAGARRESIEAALLIENELRCSPPKEEHLVRALAEDIAHRYPPGART